MSDDLALRIMLSAQDTASKVVKDLGGTLDGLGKNAGGAGGQLGGLGGILSKVGGVAGVVVGTLEAVGGKAVDIGVKATRMAAEYEQSMNKVQALTGASTDQMKQFDGGLKQLSMDTGVVPKQLSEGLYNVVSAGYQGKDAMTMLGLATKDSVIGMTDASVTTKSLSALLAQFSLGAKDATRTNGEMLETVTLGSGTFEQYASNIVKSASAASQFHVSMETMNAAYATLTSSQITAGNASTDFQQSLKVMDGNIGTVTKSLNKSGIAFDETKFNAMDYGHQVSYLNTALEEANAKHVKVTGVTLQAAQAISTIAQHIDVYNKDLSTLSDKQAMAQKTQEAWAVTAQGFNVSMDRLKATMQVVMIDIGQRLLPIATGGVNLLNNAFQGLMGVMGKFGAAVQQAGIPGFGYNLGYLVTQAKNLLGVIGNVGGMILSQFTGPLSSTSGIVSKVAEEIRHLSDFFWNTGVSVKNFADALNKMDFGEKINAVKNFGATLSSTFGPPIKTIISLLGGQFKETLNFVGTSFKAVGDWIKTSVAPALQSAMPGFMQLGAALLNIVPFLLQVREVGMQLVEGFLTHVAPVIGFIIPPVIALAGFLAGVLAGAINVVVTVGSAILTFFTKTQIGGDLLKATLIALAIPVGILGLAFIALAVQAIAGFVMAIPGMVAGFLAGAAGAWSMAAGVIALTWPILAVIGVITLIILAVQNWSSIVGVLKKAWAGIATFFTGLWAGILSGLKTAWNAIVNVIKIGAMVALAVLFAPFIAIGALFIWLYNHNTYFKALVDKIVGFFQYCIGWINHAWAEILHWLNDQWNGLLKFASDLWTKVSGAIHDGFTAAIGFIVSVWTTISGVFTSAWNNYIVKPLTDMWNSVSKFFSSVYNAYIAGPIGSLWTSISTTIGGWVTNAVDWGKNLIQGFVNGIIAKAGNVASAVGGIAGKVLAFLGFHSPAKEGPGQEADVWAPNLIKMYSSGIEAGIPQIQNSLNKLTKPIAMSLGVTGNSGVTNAIGNINLKSGLVPSTSSTPLQGGSTTTNNSGGTTIINNYYTINVPQGRLDRASAQQMAKIISDEMSSMQRRSGNLFTNTSGGRS